jgi:hypothetical protein
VRAALALITSIHRLWPSEFACRNPVNQHATVKRPIDILFGKCSFGEELERNAVLTPGDIDDLRFLDKAAWRKQVTEHLLPGWCINNREA